MAFFGKKSPLPGFENETSFRAFFEAHYLLVHRRLVSLLGDPHLSEELTQDIFISLWQRRSELPVVLDWNHYLLRAATFKAIDYRRKKKDVLIFTDDLESMEVADDDEETDNRELDFERLHTEIEALPDRCKVIFKLSRFERMSYADIAKTLDISAKTVENQIGKALKILRKNL